MTKEIPERSKSRAFYAAMMLIYSIILAVVFHKLRTADLAHAFAWGGLGIGCLFGVMRETALRRKAKKASQIAE